MEKRVFAQPDRISTPTTQRTLSEERQLYQDRWCCSSPRESSEKSMVVGSCGETQQRKRCLVSCCSSQTHQWKPDSRSFIVAFPARSAWYRPCLFVNRRTPKKSIRLLILNDSLKGRLPLRQDKKFTSYLTKLRTSYYHCAGRMSWINFTGFACEN